MKEKLVLLQAVTALYSALADLQMAAQHLTVQRELIKQQAPGILQNGVDELIVQVLANLNTASVVANCGSLQALFNVTVQSAYMEDEQRAQIDAASAQFEPGHA